MSKGSGIKGSLAIVSVGYLLGAKFIMRMGEANRGKSSMLIANCKCLMPIKGKAHNIDE